MAPSLNRPGPETTPERAVTADTNDNTLLDLPHDRICLYCQPAEHPE